MGMFYLDGTEIPFTDGDNILQAALNAGIEIPHFCYHSALGSLGACRLCAVEIRVKSERQQKPAMIKMACMQPAQEQEQVFLSSQQARQARDMVIELLMSRHPHDCPVCDEGGECRLQNMTVASRHAYRRYRGEKTTFNNQDMGPLVHHEMNRCITCYRCIRFYRDYAGGEDLGAMRLRNEVYFGRFKDGSLTSPFAGNLVEICPTGVFTDAVFRNHFARSWDLQTAPSLCPHCSVGCNTLPGALNGRLRRVRNRSHPQINPWFLCDRGRFGHGYTEHAQRPMQAMIAGKHISFEQAVAAVSEVMEKHGNKIAALGSVREDLETNALLRSMVSESGGLFCALADPVSEQITTTAVSQINRFGGAPSLIEMQSADAVLIVGDITSHAPMMALAVRQAVLQGAPLYLLHSVPTNLQNLASIAMSLSPQEVTRQLETLAEILAESSTPIKKLAQTALAICKGLRKAKRPLLLAATETLDVAATETLGRIRDLLGSQSRLAYAWPGPNTYGAVLFNHTPAADLLASINTDRVQVLLCAGQDVLNTLGSAVQWQKALTRIQSLIVLDCLDTQTARRADIFLPVAACSEHSGSFINYAGKIQAFAKVFDRQPPLPSASDWLGAIVKAKHGYTPDPTAAIRAVLPKFELTQAGTEGLPINTSAIEVPQYTRAKQQQFGPWQAALFSWYGEDPLAAWAMELHSLAPNRCASMAPVSAKRIGGCEGQKLKLVSTYTELILPLHIIDDVAADTVALSRDDFIELGIGHGDGVRLEMQT